MVFGPVLVRVFVVVGVLGVLVEVDVLDGMGAVGVLAGVDLLLVCFDPPQPAIASAAINTPES